MKPQSIVVLGGTGFVGRRLLPRLQRDGHAITVLSRNRDLHRELGVLPRVMVLNADVHDPATLARHLAGADAAINLVGILNERHGRGNDFDSAHAGLTRSLVDACSNARVPRLLQMSALRAGEGSSGYLRTRGEAEAIVRASSLAWTILRPSVIFGDGDGLFFRFASLLRFAPLLPIARAGAKFQPVYVGDVAEAFARALAHPHTAGHAYELGGPEVLALGEIVRRTARMRGLHRLVLALPDPLGFLQACIGEWLPGKPISRDNFRSLELDSIASEDGLGALGIVGTPMASVMPRLLNPRATSHGAMRSSPR